MGKVKIMIDEVGMATKREQEYNQDFYAWAIHNAQLLRDGKLSEVDIENVAEEIESMGKSEKRELANRLAVLISHLLKWQFQTTKRSKSWAVTIKDQRIDLIDLLDESPSLKKELEQKFKHVYGKSVGLASEETGLDETTFPIACPFNLTQCLDHNFFP